MGRGGWEPIPASHYVCLPRHGSEGSVLEKPSPLSSPHGRQLLSSTRYQPGAPVRWRSCHLMCCFVYFLPSHMGFEQTDRHCAGHYYLYLLGQMCGGSHVFFNFSNLKSISPVVSHGLTRLHEMTFLKCENKFSFRTPCLLLLTWTGISSRGFISHFER